MRHLRSLFPTLFLILCFALIGVQPSHATPALFDEASGILSIPDIITSGTTSTQPQAGSAVLKLKFEKNRLELVSFKPNADYQPPDCSRSIFSPATPDYALICKPKATKAGLSLVDFVASYDANTHYVSLPFLRVTAGDQERGLTQVGFTLSTLPKDLHYIDAGCGYGPATEPGCEVVSYKTVARSP
jgi:hypothetical protein